MNTINSEKMQDYKVTFSVLDGMQDGRWWYVKMVADFQMMAICCVFLLFITKWMVWPVWKSESMNTDIWVIWRCNWVTENTGQPLKLVPQIIKVYCWKSRPNLPTWNLTVKLAWLNKTLSSSSNSCRSILMRVVWMLIRTY